MNDEVTMEDLKLAAKAAGYEVVREFQYQVAMTCGAPNPLAGIDFSGLVIDDSGRIRAPWNPRNDDGDSFRLAVACHMQVLTPDAEPTAVANRYPQGQRVAVDAGTDPAAATRLAIFRAAVEIGRAMP